MAVPSEYQSYLDCFNKVVLDDRDYFYFGNTIVPDTQWSSDTVHSWIAKSTSHYSWVNLGGSYNFRSTYTAYDHLVAPSVKASTICSIYITGSDSSWAFTVQGFSKVKFMHSQSSTQQYNYDAYNGSFTIARSMGISMTDSDVPSDRLSGSFNSLASCLSFLILYWKNIRLYVNGELWSKPAIEGWQQMFLPSTVFPGYQGTLVDFGVCEETHVNRGSDPDNIAFINQYMTGDMVESGTLPTTETEIYRKGNYYLTVKRDDNSGPGYHVYYKFYSPSTNFTLIVDGGNGSYRSFYKVALAIDKDNQKGAFVKGLLSEYNRFCTVGRIISGQETETQTRLYNWLIGAEPYNWQPVSYLVGKSGLVVPLSTLSDINGGAEITTSDTTKFTLTKESNVGLIIRDLYNY